MVYGRQRTCCTVTAVQHHPSPRGRQGPRIAAEAHVTKTARLAMTAHARGGEGRPRPAAAALEPAHQPAPAADPAAAARAGLVLRAGRPPRRAGEVHRPYPRLDPEPDPAAAAGHHRRAGQGPGGTRRRGTRRRRRVHRTALLRPRPGRARAPGRPGKGAADRQHRRADARGPASRGRARRLAAEQDFAGTRRAVSTGPCGHVYFCCGSVFPARAQDRRS